MLHGVCFGEEAGARNRVFFRVRWLQPAMKGTSCVRRLRWRSFHRRIGSSSMFCNDLYCRGCLRILFCFAAGPRQSYWNGCIKAAIVICQQIFSILALVIFLSKFLLKSASKPCFFLLWRRDRVVELQFLTPLRVLLLCFAIQYFDIAL